MEYLPYIRGDIIVIDAKYSTCDFKAAIRDECLKQITIAKVDFNGNAVGTCVLWLPLPLFNDLEGCGLWPTVREVDKYGERMVLVL